MMKILNRISRLFKADMHGLLDSLEEPEIILKQAVRDMQAELDKADAKMNTLKKQQERFDQHTIQRDQQLQELQQQLKFCFAEHNDSLAKTVIRKKILLQQSLLELANKTKENNEQIKTLQAETQERRDKLLSIRDKLALFTDAKPTEEKQDNNNVTNPITQDDIELAFLYEKQQYHQANDISGVAS